MESESWDAHRMLVLDKLNENSAKINEISSGVQEIQITLAKMQTEGKVAKWFMTWGIPAAVSGAVALVIDKLNVFK